MLYCHQRQETYVIITNTKMKAPEIPALGLSFWLVVAFMVSIQPFADVIHHYTCHDRDDQC